MAIAFDAATTGTKGGSGSSLTISHTCSGNNRILLVGIRTNYHPSFISGVTYNGVALTQIASIAAGTDYHSQLWYLVAPASGTHDVVISVSDSTVTIDAGCISLTGVKQTSPIGASNTANGNDQYPNMSITTTVNDSWLVDVMANVSALNPSSSQTKQYNNQGNGNSVSGSTILEATAGAKSLNYDLGSSHQWSMCAAEILALTNTAYSMVASQGSFSLTGQDVGIKRGWTLVASYGSFVLTGISSALKYGKTLVAAYGSFTLTGNNALFQSVKTMAADTGSFALTGISAGFKIGHTLVADTGNFVLTGIDLIITRGKILIASYGSFALTGYSIAVQKTMTLIARTGSFVLTGFNIFIKAVIFINKLSNSVNLTNKDSNITTLSNKDNNSTDLTNLDR